MIKIAVILMILCGCSAATHEAIINQNPKPYDQIRQHGKIDPGEDGNGRQGQRPEVGRGHVETAN